MTNSRQAADPVFIDGEIHVGPPELEAGIRAVAIPPPPIAI